MRKIGILYLDKYDKNLLVFKAYFRAMKEYKIHLCSMPSEALQVLIHFEIDVIIVDQPSPKKMGIEFLEELPSAVKMPLKFIVSSHRDSSLLEKAKGDGVIMEYFSKPYDLKKIELVVQEYAKKT